MKGYFMITLCKPLRFVDLARNISVYRFFELPARPQDLRMRRQIETSINGSQFYKRITIQGCRMSL